MLFDVGFDVSAPVMVLGLVGVLVGALLFFWVLERNQKRLRSASSETVKVKPLKSCVWHPGYDGRIRNKVGCDSCFKFPCDWLQKKDVNTSFWSSTELAFNFVYIVFVLIGACWMAVADGLDYVYTRFFSSKSSICYLRAQFRGKCIRQCENEECVWNWMKDHVS